MVLASFCCVLTHADKVCVQVTLITSAYVAGNCHNFSLASQGSGAGGRIQLLRPPERGVPRSNNRKPYCNEASLQELPRAALALAAPSSQLLVEAA